MNNDNDDGPDNRLGNMGASDMNIYIFHSGFFFWLGPSAN